MNKFKYYLGRFLYGRYGNDSFNNFLFGLSLLLIIINLFVNSFILYWITLLLLIIQFLRPLSKNIKKRSEENAKFLNFFAPIKKRFKLINLNLKDKEHKYYACPNCGKMVRVPRGKGKIDITCPQCHKVFERKS